MNHPSLSIIKRMDTWRPFKLCYLIAVGTCAYLMFFVAPDIDPSFRPVYVYFVGPLCLLLIAAECIKDYTDVYHHDLMLKWEEQLRRYRPREPRRHE